METRSHRSAFLPPTLDTGYSTNEQGRDEPVQGPREPEKPTHARQERLHRRTTMSDDEGEDEKEEGVSKMSEESSEDTGCVCSVCWSEIVDNSCAILPCGHRLHTTCLVNWSTTQARLRRTTTCPECRRVLGSEEETNSLREGEDVQRGESVTVSVFVTPRQQSVSEERGDDDDDEDDNSDIDIVEYIIALIHEGNLEELTRVVVSLEEGERARILNYAHECGLTPLHVACLKGSSRIASILIDGGARVDVVSDTGSTALHHACYQQDTDIIALLLQKGASPNARDLVCESPLHICTRYNRTEHLITLMNAGALVDVCNVMGDTPLHLAALHFASQEIVTKLLAANPRFDLVDFRGDGPLHVAVRYRNTNFVRLYLAACPEFVRFHENVTGDSPAMMSRRMNDVSLQDLFFGIDENEL